MSTSLRLTQEFTKVLNEIRDHRRQLKQMLSTIEQMESQLQGLQAWLMGIHPGNPVSPLMTKSSSTTERPND